MRLGLKSILFALASPSLQRVVNVSRLSTVQQEIDDFMVQAERKRSCLEENFTNCQELVVTAYTETREANLYVVMGAAMLSFDPRRVWSASVWCARRLDPCEGGQQHPTTRRARVLGDPRVRFFIMLCFSDDHSLPDPRHFPKAL